MIVVERRILTYDGNYDDNDNSTCYQYDNNSKIECIVQELVLFLMQ